MNKAGEDVGKLDETTVDTSTGRMHTSSSPFGGFLAWVIGFTAVTNCILYCKGMLGSIAFEAQLWLSPDDAVLKRAELSRFFGRCHQIGGAQ
jgi:hypothetical protein